MVFTRGQKTREEYETNLAKQQSLLEQLQEVSVSAQPHYEFEASDVSQTQTSQPAIAKQYGKEQIFHKQFVTEEDLCHDCVAEQGATEEIVAESISAAEEVVEQLLFRLDMAKPRIEEHAVNEQAHIEPIIAKHIFVQQGVFPNVRGQFDGKRSVSDSAVLERYGEESLITLKSGQGITKAEILRFSGAETEVMGPQGFDDGSFQNMNEKPSATTTGEEKGSANSSSTHDLGINDWGDCESASGQAKRPSLRDRPEEVGQAFSTKAQALSITPVTPERLHLLATAVKVDDSAMDVVDESAEVTRHYDERMDDDKGTWQPPSNQQPKEHRKQTPKETASFKNAPKQRTTATGASPKTAQGLAFRPGEVVTSNVDIDAPDNQVALLVQGFKSSGGGQYVASGKKIQEMKKQTVATHKTNGKSFQIPVTLEDENDFSPDIDAVVDAQRGSNLRRRTTTPTVRKKTLGVGPSRLKKPSNHVPNAKTRSSVVIQIRQREEGGTKLIVGLSTDWQAATPVVEPTTNAKKTLLERVKTPKDFFTNQYRFKLRWTPFKEYPPVAQHTYQEVYEILDESLVPFGISLNRKNTSVEIIGAPQGPMHAGDAVTVDALVKVIMSQATTNKNALSAQVGLLQAFPYAVDGKTVMGKIPNYHDVRTAEVAKLMKALRAAGLHKKRAKIIPDCLNVVRQKNIDANSPDCSIDGNPENIADFVPGSLSLDYLNKLNAQEMFDELVSLPGIGVKTACCILAFNFQLPVFAVDTHVFRMVKWLGWVPDGCNRNDAAAHLDKFIPDELKYGLHQGFWHHGQRCLRCMAKNDPKTKGWEDAVCVIEQFLKRHPKRARKSSSPKRKRVDDDGNDNSQGHSPKAKVRRESNTIAFGDMTAEQAAERGYELRTYQLDDNFGAQGTNITRTVKEWVKKTA